jgi:pyruvate dehydrogenase E1 component beta subunit
MRNDPNVFMLGEDIGIYGGAFGVTKGMFQEFGEERVRDTPLSEHAITGAAAGAAMSGMRPVVEIMFSDFLTIALEQLANQAAKARFQFGRQVSVPMVLRTAGGSGTGASEQHSQSLEAWVCHVPGLKVVIPSTPYDAKGLLKTSIRDPNPVVFIEQKMLYRLKGPVPEPTEEYAIPLGVADIKRKGTDMTIVTWGRMVQRCLEAAGRLAAEGIEAEIIDIRSLVPLDKECIIQSVRRTGKAIIVHEACQTAGYGGEIAAVIADSEAFFYLDAPIRRVAGLDVPIPYNPVLEANAVPTLEKILATARDLMK